MLERQRHKEILRALAEKKVMTVGDIVGLLHASEATVRRDIRALDSVNKIRKIRGGAEALAPAMDETVAAPLFEQSQLVNADKKRAIARAAVDLCEEGEPIIINGGTTTYMMVEFLRTRKLQILTNSFPIAEQLIRRSENQIILPGGKIYREQQIVLSPFDADIVQNHYASKMFLGAYGLGRQGLMEADPLLIQAEGRLIGQAEKLIVLIDSSKFRSRGSLILCPLTRIDTVVTDEEVEKEHIALLNNAGVDVIIAPADAPAHAELHAAAKARNPTNSTH